MWRALRGTLLGAIVASCIRLWLLRKRRRQLDLWYPGPRESLLMGNAPDLAKFGSPTYPTPAFLAKVHAIYGDVVRLWLGPLWRGTDALAIALLDPVDWRELFDKAPHRAKAASSSHFADYLGEDNLLFQRGDMIKQLRLRYGRTVGSPEAVRALHRIVTDAMTKATVNWHRGPVDLASETLFILYDVMGEFLFKLPWSHHPLGAKIRDLHLRCAKETSKWAAYRISPWWNPDFKDYLKACKNLRKLCGQVLAERRAAVEANPSAYDNDGSVLTMLVTDVGADGRPFFDEHLAVSSMIGLMNGAFDTTHATLSWLLYHLAKNPKAQSKLAVELDGRLGRRLSPTCDELRELSFLHACVQESMRLRLTVPGVNRQNDDADIFCGKPYVFEDSGYFGEAWIPRGTPVYASMQAASRLARFFGPNPAEFIPERFIGDDPVAETARRSWLPFGGGTRMCVGMDPALAEIKAIAAVLLQRFTVELEDPSVVFEGTMVGDVLKPEGPLRLVFRQRAEQQTL